MARRSSTPIARAIDPQGRRQAALSSTPPSVRSILDPFYAALGGLGALFILDDPIFNGLAVSLIFGILVSTVLTLVVIPLLYFAYLQRFVPMREHD